MNIIQRVASMLGSQSHGTSSQFSLGSYNSSPRWGAKETTAAYSTSPILRDTAGKIAYSVATLRWVLYSVKGKRPGSRAIRHVGAQTSGAESRWSLLRALHDEGRLNEIEVSPVLDLLATANPQITGFNARRMSQLSLDLSGEMFWILDYSGTNGVPTSYWPIPPSWVGSCPDPDELLSAEERQKLARTKPEDRPEATAKNAYRIDKASRSKEEGGPWYHQHEIIWAKDPNPTDPYARGTGIGMCLGDELETDEYAAKFTKHFFLNSGKPEMLIGVEGADQDFVEAAQAKYDNRFGGMYKNGKAWWTNGKVTLKELTTRFVDTQVIELRKAMRDGVGTTYGVPPEVRGIVEPGSNRATIEGSEYVYAKHVIVPRAELLRSELQHKLVSLFDPRLVLDYVSPVPEDKEHQLSVLKASPHTATRAEWRRAQSLPDRGNGDDVHFLPGNLFETPAPAVSARKQRKTRSIGQVEMFDRGIGDQDVATEAPVVKVLGSEGIDSVVGALEPRMLVDRIQTTNEDLVEHWGRAEMRALGASAAFNMLDPNVQQWLLDWAGDRIKLINDETMKQLRETLVTGVQHGEGLREMSERVSDVMGHAKGYRSDRIARTEASRGANFARFDAYQQSGVVEKKKWVAQLLNTRDSHLMLHAQKAIPTQSYFEIGTDKALYPLGFSLPENSINCQCTMTAVTVKLSAVGELVTKDDESEWLAYDEAVQPWIKRMENAFIRGFNDQERAVMQALRANQ